MSKVNVILSIPKPREIKLVEKPYPNIVPGYALVKVRIAPICIEHAVYRDHTMEWHEDEEHLGHEGVGEIAEIAAGSRFQVGDRVIIYQAYRCGECLVCQRGLSPTHCYSVPYDSIEAGSKIDEKIDPWSFGKRLNEKICGNESGGSGFCQYRLAQESMIQKIPDGLSFKHAAAANCSCGCTHTAVEEMDVRSSDYVMVAGVGFIGFGAIINAKYRGAKVIALGRNQFRMGIARKLGADWVINPEDPDWRAKIHEITGYRKGVDVCFECSGFPFYQQRALAGVRRYGKVFFLGHRPGSDEKLPIHTCEQILDRHVLITGGHDVQVLHREGLVNMLMDPEVQKKIDIMVTHQFNMSEADKGFEAALSKKAGKIYLYPWDDCPTPAV